MQHAKIVDELKTSLSLLTSKYNKLKVDFQKEKQYNIQISLGLKSSQRYNKMKRTFHDLKITHFPICYIRSHKMKMKSESDIKNSKRKNRTIVNENEGHKELEEKVKELERKVEEGLERERSNRKVMDFQKGMILKLKGDVGISVERDKMENEELIRKVSDLNVRLIKMSVCQRKSKGNDIYEGEVKKDNVLRVERQGEGCFEYMGIYKEKEREFEKVVDKVKIDCNKKIKMLNNVIINLKNAYKGNYIHVNDVKKHFIFLYKKYDNLLSQYDNNIHHIIHEMNMRISNIVNSIKYVNK